MKTFWNKRRRCSCGFVPLREGLASVFFLVIALLLACAENAAALTPLYYWSTLAGQQQVSGTADGTGTNALFNNPQGLTVDNIGNIFTAIP